MPVCVIDSLRYVGQSRQYSSHGTTSAHRTAASAKRRGADAGLRTERYRTVMQSRGQRTASKDRRTSKGKPRDAFGRAIGQNGARGANH